MRYQRIELIERCTINCFTEVIKVNIFMALCIVANSLMTENSEPYSHWHC